MKIKGMISKRILSLVLAMVLVLAMFPLTAHAIVSGEGWYIDYDTLFVTGKLTSLPQYGYYSIHVASEGELAFADSEVWKYEVANDGTISGGTFEGVVENRNTISGGAFQSTVKNWGTISGGTFRGTVDNAIVGKISGGAFQSTVENVGSISDGTFRGQVNNEYNGYISGGTFINFVTNNYRINGGTFWGAVTNNGYIGGGIFNNGVANSNRGTIDGGEFGFTIGNQGVIVKAKLLTTAVSGNDPQSVIHKVNGEDKPLAYGKDLLGELGEAGEGTAWYTGDTCIGGGKVPLIYTKYTLKAHTHNYIYTVSGNTLTETCSNGCNHTAKAMLTTPEESYIYTGEPIMAAVLKFDENWKGSKGDGYVYKNNVDVGTATVTSNPAGKTISTTFEIKAANIADATITFNPSSGIYDGSEQKPTVSVLWNGKSLTENTDYTISWDESGLKNADIYTVTISGMGNFAYETQKTFDITQKEVEFAWGGVNFLPYTGQLVLPKVMVTNLADGDTCEVIVSVVEKVDGAGINPGKWTAKITGLSNGNYKLPANSSVPLEVEYTIYAHQTAPNVSGVAETIKGKNDGYISGLTTEMEYATEPTNLKSAYTKITDPNMIFAPGTYYVRYAAKDYYYSSPYTTVTITEGRMLTVTLPQVQEGYTLTVDKTKFAYNDSLHFTFILHDGYTMTDDFSAKFNDMILPVHYGNVVVDFCIEDILVTVEGVTDITPPVAEIKIKENKWTSFWNNLTFEFFFKETQDVTITASDKGSGVNNIQYYLSDRELEREEVSIITDWIDYNGTFKINSDNKYVIYVKVTDNAGNVVYLNSDGLILDKTPAAVNGITNGGVYYEQLVFTVSDELSGVKSVVIDGNDQTHTEGQYVIDGDNAAHTVIVTDNVGNVTEYKITVYKDKPTSIPISPQTDDGSNIALGIALFFISGGAVITLFIVNRKRKYATKR